MSFFFTTRSRNGKTYWYSKKVSSSKARRLDKSGYWMRSKITGSKRARSGYVYNPF